VLFVFNIIIVFLRPSRSTAIILIILSLFPVIIGITGSVIGAAGFKYMLDILKELGFGEPKYYSMPSYVSWLPAAIGVAGTTINIVPALLGLVFALKRSKR
jgi:hypothetical protein